MNSPKNKQYLSTKERQVMTCSLAHTYKC